MTLGAALAWYVAGVVIVRWKQPFWPLWDVFIAAPFWPLVLWLPRA
jgi:hypothetical protein